VRLEEWSNHGFAFEDRNPSTAAHLRETTFARVNTRLVAHVVSRYPTDWVCILTLTLFYNGNVLPPQ